MMRSGGREMRRKTKEIRESKVILEEDQKDQAAS